MKTFILALLVLCSFAGAEEALLTLDSEVHQHTEECDCGAECACHNNAHAYAPIGVMGSHVHKKGQWMFSYRFMFMDMDGLRDGDSRVGDSENRGMGNYMMLPEDMSMKMHMLGMMYGVTDDLTVGVMIPWIEKDMDVKAGMTGATRFRTRADGLGDIKINSMYRLWSDHQNNLLLNLGVSLPTGTINEDGNNPMAPNGARLAYPMQLGSGTVDFMPGLTFSGNNENWGYGVQAIATLRTHRNYRGYNKGNEIKFNTWISRKITKNFATSLRIELNSWDDYEGHDDDLHGRRNMMPTADNDLRGGTRADVFLGFNYLFTDGVLKNSNIGIEVGMPFYQNIEGPNLETDLIVTLGWQMTF